MSTEQADWLSSSQKGLVPQKSLSTNTTTCMHICTACYVHPTSRYPFSNTAYWCHKLQNKESLLKECRYRGMEPEELWRLPNKQIASVLISHDKTTVVIHK